jgi:hypothetical protein
MTEGHQSHVRHALIQRVLSFALSALEDHLKGLQATRAADVDDDEDEDEREQAHNDDSDAEENEDNEAVRVVCACDVRATSSTQGATGTALRPVSMRVCDVWMLTRA